MQQGSRNQSSTVVGVIPMSGAPSGPSHQIEEYWTAVVKGTRLLKFGRRGSPHMHFFRVTEDRKELQWEARNHKVRRINLSLVYKMVRGQQTDVFTKSRSKDARGLADLSFSLFYKNNNRSEDRTLDLVCNDIDEFDLWFNGLRLITEHIKKEAIGGGEVMGFTDQMIGTPAPKKSPPGDCYIWGSLPSQVQNGVINPAPASTPQLVPASQKLDIVQVACGPQHYAAVTRSGHLYTWGSGASGRLGLGTLQHVTMPTAVFGLDDMSGVKRASCGDCNTAAILTDGSICAWGDGLSGRLGHGNLTTQYLPRKIERGLQGVSIAEVSCGPYHTAAYSDNGQLYTWGDGLCGKLGHGNWEPTLTPKLVESLLPEGRVIGVSCGWWHMAAVVELGASPRNVSLYVWGGEFTWEGDHNNGCLGNGSTRGSSLPLRVEGDLGLRNVEQVACGLNLTVALSTDGLVYQMGTTGAEAAHVEWEGARNPTRVEGRLKGHFADKVACGRRHVCVVATPIVGGKLEEARKSSYLFSWGNGKNGQLGNGNNKDQSSPQLVEALVQRRIEAISCGGDYTLAVCRYDPRVAAAAFILHPDSSYSSSGNERILRKTGTPGYSSSGTVSTVFGAFKQKSVKHRRNDGSNVGPEIPMPRPAPKVIGVHTSTRVRLERQKISETTLFPQISSGPTQTNIPTPSSIAEQDETYREENESTTSVGPNSTTLVTPRRDTAPAEYRGPFGGQDIESSHRFHLSADTVYQSSRVSQDAQPCRPIPNDESMQDSDDEDNQEFENRSVSNDVLTDGAPAEHLRQLQSKDGRSSTEGSMTTTEGLGRSCPDILDEEVATDCGSQERPNSRVDIREMDELRSAARLRSRQKVLQQVLSLSESWSATEQQLNVAAMAVAGRDPTVVQSARAPRLWESERHVIRENAIDDIGMDCSRTFTSSKVMQLPGHSARYRPDVLPRLRLDRGVSLPTGQSAPLATAREQVMSKAAECEHIRQELLKYAENLQSTQTKLDVAAIEQGKDAKRLGLDICKIQDALKGSSSQPSAATSSLEMSGVAGEGSRRTTVSDESMSKVVDLVQMASGLVSRNPIKGVEDDTGRAQANQLKRENRELRELLTSLSVVVRDLGAILNVSDLPPAPGTDLMLANNAETMDAEAEEDAPISSSIARSRTINVGGASEELMNEAEARGMNMRMENVDEGVSVIFESVENVTKIKKIRFSKRLFTAARAQKWWEENQSRLVRDYSLAPGYSLGEHNPVRGPNSELREPGSGIPGLGMGRNAYERE